MENLLSDQTKAPPAFDYFVPADILINGGSAKLKQSTFPTLEEVLGRHPEVNGQTYPDKDKKGGSLTFLRRLFCFQLYSPGN